MNVTPIWRKLDYIKEGTPMGGKPL